MEKKKVVVLGASGLLGRQVYQRLNDKFDVIGTSFSRTNGKLVKLDLLNKQQVEEFLTDSKAQIVINCAAERRPDVCNNQPEMAMKLNVESASHLAQLASKLGFYYIYISTDYVFDGNSAPYKETDVPNPINFYGKSKYQGECAVMNACKEALILRVPVLYGMTEYNGESAVNLLIDVVKSGKETKMDHFQSRFPTNVYDVAGVLQSIVSLNPPLNGIFHCSAKERMTKYEMCKILGKLLNVGIDHLIPQTSAPIGEVSRPFDCQLLTEKLESAGISCKTENSFEDWFRDYFNSSI